MSFENTIHSGSGGLAHSTFGAGGLPQGEAEETVTHDKHHLGLGMWRERVSGARMHSALGLSFFMSYFRK